MFYEEEIRIEESAELLKRCGLAVPQGVDYTVGIFDTEGNLCACGSLKKDMIQGVAVDPKLQGEDLTGRLFTSLIRHSAERGLSSLYLFTKPEKALQFEWLGFRTVVTARPYATLLEWGRNGIGEYKEKLTSVRKEAEERLLGGSRTESKVKGKIAGLVMNCNPFTLGHRWLVSTASSLADIVYLIVVEEENSMFSFADRMEMVKQGTKDLENVVVISGGRYAVSALTFPSYFTGEEKVAEAHTAVDATLFAEHIAPALGINLRLVGAEPFSLVTAVYNETLKAKLPKAGIEVYELPRLAFGAGEEPISASKVRALLCGGAGRAELKELLPETTLECIFTLDEGKLWTRKK